MKYILNRDVGSYKKGTPVFTGKGSTSFESFLIDEVILNILLDLGWLDEVKDTKSVWDLVDGQEFYILSSNGYMHNRKNISSWNDERLNGNVFLTRESAEREVEIRKRMAKTSSEGLGLK